MKNSRQPLWLLVALPIAWLLVAAPVSADDGDGSLHDARDDERKDSHDQPNAQHANGQSLLYAEELADRDVSRGLAAYQRARNEEEKQENLDSERLESSQRHDDADRYYWWWPFRR